MDMPPFLIGIPVTFDFKDGALDVSFPPDRPVKPKPVTVESRVSVIEAFTVSGYLRQSGEPYKLARVVVDNTNNSSA